jgi:glutamate formiminotransferase/formiminotetrahydrofolate cyclodeaminase
MEKRIVECVPNFSEGRDMSVIKQITDSIEGVAGVKLLDVDPGWATNRTVVTFVGEVEAVVEAAFLCVVKAAQLDRYCVSITANILVWGQRMFAPLFGFGNLDG